MIMPSLIGLTYCERLTNQPSIPTKIPIHREHMFFYPCLLKTSQIQIPIILKKNTTTVTFLIDFVHVTVINVS